MSTNHAKGLPAALTVCISLAALSFSAGGAYAQTNTAPTSPATAQTGPQPAATLEEVTVTARRRQESLLNVPVVEQVVQAQTLQTFQVNQITDLPRLVPGLGMGTSLLSIGQLVSIRGIGTASQDPGVDQSVSLNIDGLSLTNGLAYNSALFDVGQVEVLKGPQSLFYGKSSPGGVIAITTADPSDHFELIGTGAYEFESIAPRGELIVSGPVTDTLKLRFAGMYQSAEGYFNNVATALPGTGAVTPSVSRAPNSRDYMMRGTALWDPVSDFTARLKVNFAHDRAINAETSQCIDAPTGTHAGVPGFPPFMGDAPCTISRDLNLVFLDPANFPGILNDGVPFLETNQAYGTLELNYHPSAPITLTSLTGYYNLSSSSMVNPYETQHAGPFLGINNHFHRRDFTQELRANSDFKGPVNFTAGALYQDGNVADNVTVLGNSAYGLPSPVEDGVTPIDIRTYSAYGQLRWDIVRRLEFAAGLRYTDEKRTESPFNYLTHQPTPVPVSELNPKRYSPEVTLTYKPTDEMTLFGAWKKAFKSGSFSIATPAVANENNSFGDEKVNGGELGVKSLWFDRQLALNLAAFYYTYDGLQVGVISPPQAGVPVIQTLNAATARTYGVDLDGRYQPAAVPRLGINYAMQWNVGSYTNFTNAPCWGGQTVALGCNQAFNPAVGGYTAQNLSGTPLIRAPRWSGSVGFDYEIPLQSGYALLLANSTQFSSTYVTYLAVGRPNNDNFQGAFAKVDLSAALRSPADRWEVAVVGKNLNDKITSGNCTASPFLTEVVANPSGMQTPSPIGIDPANCFLDPGREVWLRVTLKPF